MNKLIIIIAAALVIIGATTPIITTTPVMGQFVTPPDQSIPSTETTTNTTTTTTTTTILTAADYYTDSVKGFRVQVPDGWVVDYVNNTNPNYEQRLADYDLDILITMCPQEIALPVVGRAYTCPFPLPPSNTSAAFQLYRFVDLHARPELAALLQQNESLTTTDLLAVYIDYQRNVVITDPLVLQSMQIVTDEDVDVDIIDSQNNQTVGTAQAKFVEFTHTDAYGDGSYKQSALLVLGNDTNTGYVVRPLVTHDSNQELPDFARQVLDTFELVVPLTTNIAATTTTPSPSQGQPQPQQQQLEQSDGALTARLNADIFGNGDTITVNGTVRERGPNTAVTIDVIDPEGQTVELTQVRVTADNEFTHSFVAGRQVTFGRPMVTSGNYLMTVQFGLDRVEFTFNYNATAPASSEVTASTTTDSISIPQGSSLLTTDAFQPNPAQVSVGDTGELAKGELCHAKGSQTVGPN